MAVERGRKLSVTLLKKGIDNLLFLTHKFLAFLKAIRFALDVNDSAVMQDRIKDGGGNGNVGKDLVPLREGLIGNENSGDLFIAASNQLEEKVGALNVHREISDLINDKHPIPGEDFKPVGQAVLKMGFFELLNELVAVDIVSGEPVLSGHKAQGGGKVGLALTRGPRKTTFSPFSRKRMVASSSIWRLSMEGWKEKSKSSRVFLMGKPDIWICFS